tara:strand:- start:27344 stop:27967 length:624 start_codon:yes stop_codon:yes gene_type:complete
MSSELSEKKSIIDFVKSYSRILSILVIALIVAASIFFWLDYSNKNKKTKISETFIQAKILLANNKNSEANNLFRDIINKRDNVYSPLSLFLIIDKNLEEDKETVINYFDIVLSTGGIEKEDSNLLKLKKAIYISEIGQEQEILSLLNPIINSKSVWKLQSTKFLGDYYFSLRQFKKAKEYYLILLDENSQSYDINEIKRKIDLIENE